MMLKYWDQKVSLFVLNNYCNKFITWIHIATGEPSIVMSFVAVCAIRHALNSARADANGGKLDEWFPLG